MSQESSEENVEGKNQTEFLAFLRKILQWMLEGRLSAKELLKNP